MKELEIAKCYSCNNSFIFGLMKPVTLVQPSDEGIIKVKRYLCKSCNNKLKKAGFIQKSAEEREKNLRRNLENGRRKKTRSKMDTGGFEEKEIRT